MVRVRAGVRVTPTPNPTPTPNSNRVRVLLHERRVRGGGVDVVVALHGIVEGFVEERGRPD